MEYFDSLIQEYYRVLINAYTAELEEAADAAIKLLITVPKAQRNDKKLVTDVVNVINEGCGADFAATVNKPVKAFMERCVRLGYNDAKKDLPVKISIGRYGAAEQSLAVKCTKEQVFWVGNQFGAETSQKFSQELGNMLKQGLTNKELATNLQKTFKDIKGKSKHYFAGLADHTALRVREFGRLEGYRRAGARGYKLVNPNDERTSDICRALIAANKIYPLEPALQVRDKLLAIADKPNTLDKAKEEISALAPWVKPSQIIRDSAGNPKGVQGAHTPFPPFHWRCRTRTVVVL